MTTRPARRAPLVALAAVAALALGGCGSLPPGAASVVDGTTIQRSDVTELAEAQCEVIEQAAAREPAQPRANAFAELAGRLAGERQTAPAFGQHQAVGDEPDDAGGHGFGLARARARDDQRGFPWRGDDRGLLRGRRMQPERRGHHPR